MKRTAYATGLLGAWWLGWWLRGEREAWRHVMGEYSRNPKAYRR